MNDLWCSGMGGVVVSLESTGYQQFEGDGDSREREEARRLFRRRDHARLDGDLERLRDVEVRDGGGASAHPLSVDVDLTGAALALAALVAYELVGLHRDLLERLPRVCHGRLGVVGL